MPIEKKQEAHWKTKNIEKTLKKRKPERRPAFLKRETKLKREWNQTLLNFVEKTLFYFDLEGKRRKNFLEKDE